MGDSMSTIRVDTIKPNANTTGAGTVTVDGDLHCQNVSVADLIMTNERPNRMPNIVDGTRGNWTFQEGVNDLFLINNKNGKKFKIVLEEIHVN